MTDELDAVLRHLCAGRDQYLIPALECLGETSLVIPSGVFEDEKRGSSSELLIRRVSSGMMTLLAFSKRDRFNSWSKGRYEALCLPALDLPKLLAPSCSLTVNPESDCEYEFSPIHLASLFRFSKRRARTISEGLDFEERIPGEIATLQRRLSDMLARFPEVLQASYVCPSKEYPGGLLGLITEAFLQHRRSSFLEELSLLAANILGPDHVPQIFTDVRAKSSVLWLLVREIAPFYSRVLPQRNRAEA